jgi:hypothetical protein
LTHRVNALHTGGAHYRANQKRHGTFDLGGRVYHFERRMNVPRKLSKEFLLVDLVNEVDQLAEDRDALLARVRENAGAIQN